MKTDGSETGLTNTGDRRSRSRGPATERLAALRVWLDLVGEYFCLPTPGPGSGSGRETGIGTGTRMRFGQRLRGEALALSCCTFAGLAGPIPQKGDFPKVCAATEVGFRHRSGIILRRQDPRMRRPAFRNSRLDGRFGMSEAPGARGGWRVVEGEWWKASAPTLGSPLGFAIGSVHRCLFPESAGRPGGGSGIGEDV